MAAAISEVIIRVDTYDDSEISLLSSVTWYVRPQKSAIALTIHADA